MKRKRKKRIVKAESVVKPDTQVEDMNIEKVNLESFDINVKPFIWIDIRFTDGEWYKIPACMVAEDLAGYVVSKSNGSVNFNNVVESVIRNKVALVNWASSRMKWQAFRERAMKIAYYNKNIDYHKEWEQAYKECVYE